MRDFINRHRKKLIIGRVVIFLTILITSLVFIINDNLNSVTVNITVSPLTAKVKIGEKEYSATETIRIRPGTYTVEVYADGFVTKTGELVAVEDETVSVSLYLDPTEENSDWYKDHVWDETARGDIISDNALQGFYESQKDYPILNYVPYNTFTYVINYEEKCAENGGAMCLTIDADFGFRDYAVEYLQSTGQDLSLYYIKGYELPFRQVGIEVPDGLEFEEELVSSKMNGDEYTAVSSVVNGLINETFDGYKAGVKQVKKYSDIYYGVTIAVYQEGYGDSADTYRMIVGKINGEWVALTNIDVILSRYKNPKVPSELLKLVNNF